MSQEGSGGGDSSNTVAALLRLRELTAACSASAAQRSLSHEIFLKQLSQDARALPESRETSDVPTAQVPGNESFGRSGSRLQCPYCSYSTTYLHSLRRHVRSHTGEKPYHCDQCDKSFNKSDSLVVHRRVHTGEKPYSCDRCLYRCRQKSNLVTHQLKHLGLKYACTICDYRSYQKGHVKVHMWNRHKVIYEGGQLVGPENVVTS